MELYKANSAVKVTWVCPYAIATGMFEGFFAKRPWLVDILTPESVAESVIYGIQTNADRLFLPGSLNISMVNKNIERKETLTFFKILNQILPRKAGLTFLSWGGVLDAMNDVR